MYINAINLLYTILLNDNYVATCIDNMYIDTDALSTYVHT